MISISICLSCLPFINQAIHFIFSNVIPYHNHYKNRIIYRIIEQYQILKRFLCSRKRYNTNHSSKQPSINREDKFDKLNLEFILYCFQILILTIILSIIHRLNLLWLIINNSLSLFKLTISYKKPTWIIWWLLL